MDCELIGKIAIITGGAQGIGLAAANVLAAEGATVIIGDLGFNNDGELEKKSFDGNGSIYQGYLDVTNEKAVKIFFKAVVDKFQTIDILYNNAGICQEAIPFENIEKANWDKMFAVNTFGGVYCLNEVIPIMKKQKNGKIIISSSLAAEVGGLRTIASYAATKAANMCIMMSLAKQLGVYNINVNAVAPGIIASPMTDTLSTVDSKTIPLQRIGQGSDVGNVVLFLSCHMSDYLTGVVIDINGGQHFR